MVQYRDVSASEPEDGSAPTNCLGCHFTLSRNRPQYVPYTKQQWGAVRFDYGAETIHLAPHVNAPEAAKIADWLRRRLPVSAFS